MRFPSIQEVGCSKTDPDLKALVYYGLLVRRRPLHSDHLLLRFVQGRPVSASTTALLPWATERQPDSQAQRAWGADHAVWTASETPLAELDGG
jgi:hypothetical protein